MKIAIVSSDNSDVIEFGGKHVHQRLLSKALKILGNEVVTFYPHDEIFFLRKLLKTFVKNPASLFSVFNWYKTRNEEFLDFFSKIDFGNFDVVHCHDVRASYGVRLRNSNSKIILTLHGYFANEAINYLPINISRSYKKRLYDFFFDIERKGIESADYYVCVDSRIKKYVQQTFSIPEDKIEVVHNAVDTQLFSPVSTELKIKIREELKLPKDKFIVLVPRRFVKKNGVTYAARAFKSISSPDYYFLFIGDGPQKKEILKIVSGKNNIAVLNAVPNSLIHKYYKASDLVLIPSVTSDNVEEATSLSMLEGMACGKITVCTNIGGMKEIVKNFENGILIEQKDENAIISAIEYCKNNYDSLSNMMENARFYVEEKFSYINHARKMLEIYSKVITHA